MHTTYLALGSNLGDRLLNLTQAIHEISKNIGQVSKTSQFYRTDPLNPASIKSQPEFLNAVIECVTDLNPSDLLRKVHEIENLIGLDRNSKEYWGPRIIDIDILTYDAQIISDGDLILPHKEMLDRDFVLVPFEEIAPDFMHPVENKKISDLLLSLKARSSSTYVIAPLVHAD